MRAESNRSSNARRHVGRLQIIQLTNGLYRVRDVIHHETRFPMLENFGDRTVAPCDHRRTACQGFDHDQSERLRPIDRKQQRSRVAQQFILFAAADLTDKLDERPGIAQERLDRLVDNTRDPRRKSLAATLS